MVNRMIMLIKRRRTCLSVHRLEIYKNVRIQLWCIMGVLASLIKQFNKVILDEKGNGRILIYGCTILDFVCWCDSLAYYLVPPRSRSSCNLSI